MEEKPGTFTEPRPLGTAITGGSRIQWGEMWSEVVELFASVKLAIFLFIVLAITATIGTVLQQGERPEVYIEEYGEEAYRWIVRLGWMDVYHTWWFTGLLGLLCVNSLTCFYKRFPAIWRSTQHDKVNVSTSFIQNLKTTTEIPVSPPQRRVAEQLVHLFLEKGYRVLANNDSDQVTVYATKGIMGRIGAHTAHLSATVIVLGGLIGSVWGFQEFGVCLEGETYHIPEGKFDLRVDKFWIDYHPNGAVKSYNSTLAVIDGGKEVMAKTISVNHPLVYKDIWFYQSSYGKAWDRIEVARIRIKDKDTDKVVGAVDLEWQQKHTIKDLGLTLSLTDFVSDFGFNSQEKKVFSQSMEHKNPAIRLAIWEGDHDKITPWIFYHYPDLFSLKGSQYTFELVGYKPKQFTGLQISKDPGVNIVWVGSTMIVVGITLSSFIYHRRLWAKVVPRGNGEASLVYFGGTSHKSQIDFQKEFRKLTDRIQTLT